MKFVSVVLLSILAVALVAADEEEGLKSDRRISTLLVSTRRFFILVLKFSDHARRFLNDSQALVPRYLSEGCHWSAPFPFSLQSQTLCWKRCLTTICRTWQVTDQKYEHRKGKTSKSRFTSVPCMVNPFTPKSDQFLNFTFPQCSLTRNFTVGSKKRGLANQITPRHVIFWVLRRSWLVDFFFVASLSFAGGLVAHINRDRTMFPQIFLTCRGDVHAMLSFWSANMLFELEFSFYHQ